VLRRIFGAKREEVIGSWRKLHNEELYNLYSDWLRAGLSDDQGSILGGGWEFFSSPPRPDRIWSPPSLLSNGYHKGFFLGNKAAGG